MCSLTKLIAATVLVVASFACSSYVSAGTTVTQELSGVIGGELAGDTTYRVTGNLVVPDGTSLTVSSGTVFLFDGHYYFDVQGEVDATGSSVSPVVFTAADTATGWAGLRIIDNVHTSTFEHVTFEHGWANGVYVSPHYGPEMSGGACYIENGNASFGHCVFRENRATVQGTALCVRESRLWVDSCLFTLNESMQDLAGFGAVWCDGQNSSNALFHVVNSTFSHNIARDEAPAIGFKSVSPSASILVANNSFIFNTCYGNWYPGSSSTAIFDEGLIINNLFYGNTLTSGAQGPAKCIVMTRGSELFRNNIFWGNTGHSQFINISSGSATVENCLIQGGYPGTGNISEDPVFVDPDAGDFSLQQGSPAIDAGDDQIVVAVGLLVDQAGNTRILGEHVDMGPFEFDASPVYELSVAGDPLALGISSPYDYGLHSVTEGSEVSLSVNSPVSLGTGERAVCIGWTGTGSVPASGATNVVDFVVSTNSSVTWLWQEQVAVTAVAVSNGSVQGTGWYEPGSVVEVTAVADTGSTFVAWSGVASGSQTENPITITVDGPVEFTAYFVIA